MNFCKKLVWKKKMNVLTTFSIFYKNDLQKKKYINLPHKKKNLYTKLTYYDNLNKNVEQPPTWKSQEFVFNKNKSNATSTKISQQILCSKQLLILIWAQH